jgi:glycosyltransferase involved in cell wall biosynthesis
MGEWPSRCRGGLCPSRLPTAEKSCERREIIMPRAARRISRRNARSRTGTASACRRDGDVRSEGLSHLAFTVGSAAVRVSFLVPAYNEARTIVEVLDRVSALDFEKQIVVVDDGSTDGTGDLVENWRTGRDNIVLVRQENRGKGAAVRAAIPHAEGDVCVIQDADLEYDPVDVPALIEPITLGRADVVFGSRLSGGKPQRAYLFWHLVGNRFLSLLTNVLYNTTLSDMETGYKAFRTEVLRSLDLRQDDFGIEPEITAKVCKQKLRIYELPIAYYGRSYAEGKKITWRDGFKAVRVLLSVRLFG